MKSNYFKRKLPFLIPLVLVAIGMWYYIYENTAPPEQDTPIHQIEKPEQTQKQASSPSSSGPDMKKLTQAEKVISYVKSHGDLPNYYISKAQAKKIGWDPQEENLCDILPGKAIGGDQFSNREGKLPQKEGRQYFEADLNYGCGSRSADRMIYSNDGLVYITTDQYRSFEKKH